MNDAFFIWLIGYAVPAFVAGVAIKILPKSQSRLNIRNALIACASLSVSIISTQIYIHAVGYEFPWTPSLLSITCALASILIAYRLMGMSSLAYWAYCLLQEITLLSITFLLLSEFSLLLIVALVVPFFVWCHPLYVGKLWLLRIALFTAWGIISLSLFYIIKDIYIITAFHSILGAWFISKSILYSQVYDDMTSYLRA